jgi:DTW domain
MEIPVMRKPDEPFDSVVLLFPTNDAKSLTEMKKDELEAIKRVIIIDCTWN